MPRSNNEPNAWGPERNRRSRSDVWGKSGRTLNRNHMRRLPALVLVLAAASACVASPGGSGGSPSTAIGPPSGSAVGSSSGAGPSPSLVAPSSSSSLAWSPPPVPTAVEGRPVQTVSQAIADRDAGRAGSGSFLLGGYWTSSLDDHVVSDTARDASRDRAGLRQHRGGHHGRYEAINNVIYGVNRRPNAARPVRRSCHTCPAISVTAWSTP